MLQQAATSREDMPTLSEHSRFDAISTFSIGLPFEGGLQRPING